MKSILVTGGAGFIGSNFVRFMLDREPECRIVALDALTYAGNLSNLDGLSDTGRFEFVHGNICDRVLVERLLEQVDAVVNFAAESHVDRSILNPDAFVETNVKGTYTLLDAARKKSIERFLQVSTDEVYGHVPEGWSSESAPFHPRSPYAASKASAELLVQSYFTTYGLPTLITRGGNTIGPYQYPEKVVPVFVTNALEGRNLPVYGDGSAVRAYMHVEDHCAGIHLALRKGIPGAAYNIGTDIEISGLVLVDRILELLQKPKSLIEFVADRPGHDLRYALDCRRIRELGWELRFSFDQMMEHTVRWYVENRSWWSAIKSDREYQNYYRKQYQERVLQQIHP